MSKPRRSLNRFALSRLLPALLVLAFLQATIGYAFVARPLVQRSAEQFAVALADGSTKSVAWQPAPPGPIQPSLLPFNHFLLRASRAQGAIGTAVSVDAGDHYWLYWSPQRGYVRFSAEEVIGARPGAALLSWLLSTLAVAALGAVLLARGLLQPIRLLQEDLAARIRSLGQAQADQPLSIAELEQLRLDVARLCERLRQALDDRTVLLLGLSHELRGPLARLSLREATSSESTADLVEMRETLDQFLAAANVLGKPSVEPVSAEKFIDELAGRYLQAACIEFAARGTGSRSLNRVALQRIAFNLLDNALRHAPAASVHCTLHVGSAGWLLVVEDDGPGLSSTRQQQPFSALMPGHGGGLGLGLALSRLLAEQNGWQLTLQAAARQGLRFSLHF